MRVTIALGGNALLKRGQRPDADVQRANVREAAAVLAEIARDHEVVVTHGNGPQVGHQLIKNELTHDEVPSWPMDVLVAATG